MKYNPIYLNPGVPAVPPSSQHDFRGSAASDDDTYTCYTWFAIEQPDGSWSITIIEHQGCVPVTGEGPGDSEGGDSSDPGGGNPGDGVPTGDTPCDEQLTPTGGCPLGDLEDNTFEAIIDMAELDPCMQDEMNTLTTINQGVGEIIRDFAIDELEPDTLLGNMNWTIEDGDLPDDKNAITKTEFNNSFNTVTTILTSINLIE